MSLSRPDPHEDGDRWQTLGRAAAGTESVLFVVHTEPEVWDGEEIGRIISARRADRLERQAYEHGGFF